MGTSPKKQIACAKELLTSLRAPIGKRNVTKREALALAAAGLPLNITSSPTTVILECSREEALHILAGLFPDAKWRTPLQYAASATQRRRREVGSAWEERISEEFQLEQDLGNLAYTHHSGLKVVGQAGRGQVRAVRTSQVVDFTGAVVGGRAFAFDAKHSESDKAPIRDWWKQTGEELARYDLVGAFTGFYVLAHNCRWLLPVRGETVAGYDVNDHNAVAWSSIDLYVLGTDRPVEHDIAKMAAADGVYLALLQNSDWWGL